MKNYNLSILKNLQFVSIIIFLSVLSSLIFSYKFLKKTDILQFNLTATNKGKASIYLNDGSGKEKLIQEINFDNEFNKEINISLKNKNIFFFKIKLENLEGIIFNKVNLIRNNTIIEKNILENVLKLRNVKDNLINNKRVFYVDKETKNHEIYLSKSIIKFKNNNLIKFSISLIFFLIFYFFFIKELISRNLYKLFLFRISKVKKLNFFGVLFLALFFSIFSNYFFTTKQGDTLSNLLAFEVKIEKSDTFELFYDDGSGFNASQRKIILINTSDDFVGYSINFPANSKRLRLDIGSLKNEKVKLKNIKIANKNEEKIVLDLKPSNQIDEINIDKVKKIYEIKISKEYNDPSVIFSNNLKVKDSYLNLKFFIKFLTNLVIFFTLIYGFIFLRQLSFKVNKVIPFLLISSIFFVLLSNFSIIFDGKSVFKGQGGIYGECPFNYYQSEDEEKLISSICSFEHTPGADTGAMEWQHYPLMKVQELSYKNDNQIPLWNRYNSSGLSLIGQGQMMIGDPINLAIFFFGLNPFALDLKFIILKILFVFSCSCSTYRITKCKKTAFLTSFLSAFIGYFIFKVSHPSIFTMCYSSLLLFAWINLITANKIKFINLSILVFANWLIINSGTGKEAYTVFLNTNLFGIIFYIFVNLKNLKNIIFVVWTGISSVLICMPFIGTFYDEISNGTSNYHNAGSHIHDLSYFFSLIDNIFWLIPHGYYATTLNLFIFFGLIGSFFFINENKFVKGLSIYNLILIIIAYGILPENFYLKTPFIKNIIHILNTYAHTFIPSFILQSSIFYFLIFKKDEKLINKIILKTILISLIFFFMYLFKQYDAITKTIDIELFLIFTVSIIYFMFLSTKVLKEIFFKKISYRFFFFFIFLFFLTFKNSTLPKSKFDLVFYNPNDRIDNLKIPPEYSTIKKMNNLNNKINYGRAVGLNDLILPGTNALFQIETITGPDALRLKNYDGFLRNILKIPYNNWGWRAYFKDTNIENDLENLSFLNVRFILSQNKLDSDYLKLIKKFPRTHLYENLNYWPRAFLTNKFKCIKENANPNLFVKKIIEDKNIYIENCDKKFLKFINEKSFVTNNLESILFKNNTTEIIVDINEPAFLYLNESFAGKDFEAFVNNKKTKIYKSNFIHKGIFLDNIGIQKIKISFFPDNLKIYLYMSLFGLFSLIILSFTMFLIYKKNYLINK